MLSINAATNTNKNRSFYWPTTRFLINEQKETPKSRRRATSYENIGERLPTSIRHVNYELGKSLESCYKHDVNHHPSSLSAHVRHSGGRSKSFLDDPGRTHLATTRNGNSWHSLTRHTTPRHHASLSRSSSKDSDDPSPIQTRRMRKERSKTLPSAIYTTVDVICDSSDAESLHEQYENINKSSSSSSSASYAFGNSSATHSSKKLRTKNRLNKYLTKVKNIF